MVAEPFGKTFQCDISRDSLIVLWELILFGSFSRRTERAGSQIQTAIGTWREWSRKAVQLILIANHQTSKKTNVSRNVHINLNLRVVFDDDEIAWEKNVSAVTATSSFFFARLNVKELMSLSRMFKGVFHLVLGTFSKAGKLWGSNFGWRKKHFCAKSRECAANAQKAVRLYTEQTEGLNLRLTAWNLAELMFVQMQWKQKTQNWVNLPKHVNHEKFDWRFSVPMYLTAFRRKAAAHQKRVLLFYWDKMCFFNFGWCIKLCRSNLLDDWQTLQKSDWSFLMRYKHATPLMHGETNVKNEVWAGKSGVRIRLTPMVSVQDFWSGKSHG